MMKKKSRSRTHKQKNTSSRGMRRNENRAPLETRIESEQPVTGGPTEGAA
jgi:hypothetical protein